MPKVNAMKTKDLWNSFEKYTERVSRNIEKIALSIVGLCFLFSGGTVADLKEAIANNVYCQWSIIASIASLAIDLLQNIYGSFAYLIHNYRCEDEKGKEDTSRLFHLPFTIFFLLKIISITWAAYLTLVFIFP